MLGVGDEVMWCLDFDTGVMVVGQSSASRGLLSLFKIL